MAEVIEAATVDESAITGESAPVVRESGGDLAAPSREAPESCQDEIKVRGHRRSRTWFFWTA